MQEGRFLCRGACRSDYTPPDHLSQRGIELRPRENDEHQTKTAGFHGHVPLSRQLLTRKTARVSLLEPVQAANTCYFSFVSHIHTARGAMQLLTPGKRGNVVHDSGVFKVTSVLDRAHVRRFEKFV